jgi:hypothetical protein
VAVPNPAYPSLWIKAVVAPNKVRRCTIVHMVVHTATGDASATTGCSAEARWSLPQGWWCIGQGMAVPSLELPSLSLQMVTTTGVVVHRTRGGGAPRAAPQAKLHLLFFTFFVTFANVLTL